MVFPVDHAADLKAPRPARRWAKESLPVVVRVDGPVRLAVQKRRARNRRKVLQASAINPCKTDLKATAGVHSKGKLSRRTSTLRSMELDSFTPGLSQVTL